MKFTYMPYREAIVHSITEMDITRFLEVAVLGAEAQKQGTSPFASWIGGIVFSYRLFPDTPEIIAQKLQGKLHYESLVFSRTEYEEYKKVFVKGTEHRVKLIKASETLSSLPEFLNDVKPPKELNT